MRSIRLLLAAALLAPALAPAAEPSAPPDTGSQSAEETAAPTPPVAGRVELVEGDVLFINAGGGRRPQVETPVYEGELVHTGADGEVHLRMEDGGLIAVRPNTRMNIQEFRAEGQDTDRVTLGLLEGGFRALTGWIARFNRANYRVRTPNATIGVRGTDHEPFVIPEGSALGEPGTYDKVNQGGTYIETEQGRVEVEPGRAAFAHFRRTERPRVLAQAPGFFRGGRHEARIGERYQEIQQRLQERREERRQRFEQRRAEREAAQAERRQRIEERRGPREAQGPERGERRRGLQEQRREQLERGRGDRPQRLEDRRREPLERGRSDRPQRLEERRGAREAQGQERGERRRELQQRRSRDDAERPQRGSRDRPARPERAR